MPLETDLMSETNLKQQNTPDLKRIKMNQFLNSLQLEYLDELEILPGDGQYLEKMQKYISDFKRITKGRKDVTINTRASSVTDNSNTTGSSFV